MFDISPDIVVVAVLLAIVAHAAWAVLSTRCNPLFLLATGFLMLSPFSLATSLPFVGVYKVARVYCTLLMCISAGTYFRDKSLAVPGKMFLSFIAFCLLAAVWSDHPSSGLYYKGIFAMVVGGSVLLPMSINSFQDLHRALRLWLAPVLFWALLIGGYIAAHPGEVGRLTCYDMNANLIGHVSAMNAILCVYLMLYDNVKWVRVSCVVLALMMAIIIPLTGSRGAFGVSIVGVAILFVPLVRSPAKLLVSATVLAVGLYVVSAVFASSSSAERLFSSEDNRSAQWSHGLDIFFAHPVAGCGFDYFEQNGTIGSGNLHSMYIQVLAETGVIGSSFLVIVLFVVVRQAINMVRLSATLVDFSPPAYLALSLLISLLGAGIFDAGPLVGTGSEALYWGFSIGLVDRMPVLISTLQWQLTADDYDEDDEFLAGAFAQ